MVFQFKKSRCNTNEKYEKTMVSLSNVSRPILFPEPDTSTETPPPMQQLGGGGCRAVPETSVFFGGRLLCLNIRSAHPQPPLARGGRVVSLSCSPSQSVGSKAPEKFTSPRPRPSALHFPLYSSVSVWRWTEDGKGSRVDTHRERHLKGDIRTCYNKRKGHRAAATLILWPSSRKILAKI